MRIRSFEQLTKGGLGTEAQNKPYSSPENSFTNNMLPKRNDFQVKPPVIISATEFQTMVQEAAKKKPQSKEISSLAPSPFPVVLWEKISKD